MPPQTRGRQPGGGRTVENPVRTGPRLPADRHLGRSKAVDLHRLAEQRSLAYHRIVADRLIADPGLLTRARARVADWMTTEPQADYVRAWADLLSRPLPEITRFLVDDGERARELRQSTPFAGALDARERWKLWREVAERFRGAA